MAKRNSQAGLVENRAPARWVFILSALLLTAAMVVVAYVVLYPSKSADTAQRIVQYRITIALVCFVISSISALLFAAKVEIKAALPLLGITLAGPSAMWLAAFLILTFTLPENEIFSSPTPKQAANWVLRAEESLGWSQYKKWKAELGDAVKIIEDDEEHMVNFFLPRVYYHGIDVDKLQDPRVSTVFVYLDRTSTIKFQRIFGRRVHDEPPSVYMTASPSNSEGVTRTFYFVRRDDRITKAKGVDHGSWEKINSKIVDCLLVTIYDNDLEGVGDWIYVDLPKYIDRRASSNGSINLSVMSTDSLTDFNLWEMTNSQIWDLSPAPLLFRQVKGSARSVDAENVYENFGYDRFGNWFELLDKHATAKDLGLPANEYLEELRDRFAKQGFESAKSQSPFRSLLNDEKLRIRQKYAISSASNGVFGTFLWGARGRGVETASAPQPQPGSPSG